MRRKLVSLVLVASMTATFSAPVASQDGCMWPTTNSWLRQGSITGDQVEVSHEHVRPVVRNMREAIALLSTRSTVPLTRQQVRQFVGPTAKIGNLRLRPYLVRAVFPSPNPTVGVSWNGGNLFVFAGGLGCAPYVKHPIVVFLDRSPKQVFVRATAAL